MNCLVTAGPTYEPIDEVRRLTNFSTGALGTRLAGFLAAQGWTVTLLRGRLATFGEQPDGVDLVEFTTSAALAGQLEARQSDQVRAVFHAAAVGDFAVSRVLRRTAEGGLEAVHAGKLDSRGAPLLLELTSTPKIIARLRDWFPKAFLAGWKYEVDGDRATTIAKARRQCVECGTNVCVANGPAYGDGFALVRADEAPLHFPDADTLFPALGVSPHY
ncbi:MAG: DNA/pantothenate metabolism flavoprotein domain protein [Verrucomicrobiales bacterium]|nr:DNA/pantothenate metabolism flavoprotein domain protein [Verrucomicrobiales bacterium]